MFWLSGLPAQTPVVGLVVGGRGKAKGKEEAQPLALPVSVPGVWPVVSGPGSWVYAF